MFCPYCELNITGQHEVHCPMRRWQHDPNSSDAALQNGYYIYDDSRSVWERPPICIEWSSEDGVRHGIL